MKTPTGMPSASRLQLAVMCPASQALTHVDSHHEAGDEGNDLHELLRRELMTLRNPSERPQQESKWLDAVLETVGDRLDVGLSAELAFGYDTATGATVFHGAAIGRNYPDAPTVINGSVDYVAVGTDKALAVDLKTGLADVAAVHRNQQLRFAALVVGAWTGLPTQTAILHAPRDGRRPWWEWGPTYDALDLVEVGDVFKSMAARIDYARRDVAAGRTPRLTTGKHCEHCPARLRCPAQVELVSRWAGKPVEAKRELEQLMDVETAGLAWARVEAVEAAVKEAKRQLCAFASVQPFPLADGRIVGKHRVRGRDDVDAEAAWKWLVERYGVAVAKEAMTLKASKSSIRGAIGSTATRGQKRATVDAALAEMEAAGIVSEKWTEDVSPYDPRDSSTQAVTDAPRLKATTDGVP